MKLSDEFLIAAALSATVIAPSALGLTLLSRSAPADLNYSAPAVEEVFTLPLFDDENEELMPISAERVMLDQLFDFGNP